VEPLIRALADPRYRRGAALALGSIHDSRAVEALCAVVLDGAEPADREAAAWALGEIRDPRAVEALLGATHDGDYRVRNEAIAGFDKLGNAAITVAIGGMMQRVLEASASDPALTASGETSSLEEGVAETDTLTEERPAVEWSTTPIPDPEPPEPAPDPAAAAATPATVPPARPRPVREALAERAAPLLRRLLEPRDVSGSR
jgi:pyruvate/2-oxoglutarate dehydrogenase complex dihydrolipoamide acyltransferase (E2) component